MAPILGYWDIRGLANPIRLMLEQAGVEYVDKLYTRGPPPTYEPNEWKTVKFSLDLDFPNLPYFIDGDIKLSQSGVICRYIARKYGLDGKTEADQLRAQLLEAQIYDYIMDMYRVIYNPQFRNLIDDYHKGMPDKLKAIAKFISDDKFVCVDYVTYADFILFEYLESQMQLNKNLLEEFPKLYAYRKRILAMPAVDRYFQSDRAIMFPFNGAPAYFGGQYSEQLSKQ